MPQYTIGTFSFWDDTGTPVQEAIRISSANVPTEAEVSSDDTGELYDQAHSLTRFGPVMSISTKAIDKVLSYIGLGGQCVSSTDAVTQCDLITRALQTCKDTFGASSHMRHRVTRGLLVLNSLTAERNQDATISFTLHCFTDGTNAPVAENNAVALPTTVVGSRFRLGQCALGGVELPDLESVTIDFNVSLTDKDPRLGSIWPESAGVISVKPEITFRGRDLSQVRTAVFPLGASATTHANTKIQLLKLANSGSFVAAATAEHMVFTAAGILVPDTLVNASQGSRATTELRLRTVDDGTNAPIVSTVAAYDTTPAS